MYSKLQRVIILVIYLHCLQFSLAEAEKKKGTEYYFGVMDISIPMKDSETLCFVYPQEYYELNPSSAKPYNLLDYSDIDLCEDDLANTTLPKSGPDTVFVLAARSNCSVQHNFIYVKQSGAGLVLVSDYKYSMNQSYGLDVFAVISDLSKFETLNLSTPGITVKFYGGRGFNFSTLVLWFLAVFCILIGSCTGIPTFTPSSFISSETLESGEADKDATTTQDPQLGFSLPLVLAMVVFITTTLLLLYFFYKYLVYFFIAIFCIASARATFNILRQILSCCCNVSFYKCGFLTFLKGELDMLVRAVGVEIGVDEILLGLISLSLPVIWFVFRHNYLVSAILQDTLGVCFCINMIQTLRVPNLKLCTSLLSLLFVYDIFFVFITPFFTANGESIMGAVATGGSGSGSGESYEALPLLLKVPQLGKLSGACAGPSLLGFGDIIVPGLLTGFAYSFDVLSGNKYRPYFISTSIGYIIGLTGAFVALYLTNTGQPALLYIVPSTLIMIFSVGLWRKEVRGLWRGVPRETI